MVDGAIFSLAKEDSFGSVPFFQTVHIIRAQISRLYKPNYHKLSEVCMNGCFPSKSRDREKLDLSVWHAKFLCGKRFLLLWESIQISVVTNKQEAIIHSRQKLTAMRNLNVFIIIIFLNVCYFSGSTQRHKMHNLAELYTVQSYSIISTMWARI